MDRGSRRRRGTAAPSVRARLAARRDRQDQLVDVVLAALAARDDARAALAKADAALVRATALLADRGLGRAEAATLLGVPADRLGGPADRPSSARPRLVRADPDPAGDEAGEAVRIWLAMIEKGPAPRTHAQGSDGWLLCQGRGEAEHLATWVGYAFDVDCARCARLLADELTEAEFG